jgi:hypothetical protein
LSLSYDHFLNVFLVAPLLATTAATVATLHLEKCRNLYICLHHERQARVLCHEGRLLFFSKSISREVLERSHQILYLTRFEAIALAHSLYKNWIILTAFIASQHFGELASAAGKSFHDDLGRQ